jgi:hypothetical protein
VFVVRSDGFDHEIESVGAVDLSGNAVAFVWRNDPGFGEVVQPVDPSRRIIDHEEHNTAAAFRPREQNEVIGAEVEHGRPEEREPKPPRLMGGAVVELAG